ncbi:hypothetical protein [Rheinheimera oceanensis]|uniref:hypothetical protein n=1 Tax=Rheinheimera oceanensis TaxID=2817449 RepID=UPI001BFE09E2|nr:hypothetical protein [Rheinheimera oceanensis]
MNYPPLNAQALRYLQQLQQRLNASGSEFKPYQQCCTSSDAFKGLNLVVYLQG